MTSGGHEFKALLFGQLIDLNGQLAVIGLHQEIMVTLTLPSYLTKPEIYDDVFANTFLSLNNLSFAIITIVYYKVMYTYNSYSVFMSIRRYTVLRLAGAFSFQIRFSNSSHVPLLDRGTTVTLPPVVEVEGRTWIAGQVDGFAQPCGTVEPLMNLVLGAALVSCVMQL